MSFRKVNIAADLLEYKVSCSSADGTNFDRIDLVLDVEKYWMPEAKGNAVPEEGEGLRQGRIMLVRIAEVGENLDEKLKAQKSMTWLPCVLINLSF